MPQPQKEPLTHLNRAHHRIRQACEDLQAFRTKMPKEITEQRNSMFREDLKSLLPPMTPLTSWPIYCNIRVANWDKSRRW